MSGAVNLSPIYPNAPLVEAVFEIRFPGEPAVECRRDEFFELIRSEYGHVFVPKAQPGQAPALQLYNFKREDNQTSVMTAINRFAFSTKKYEGFQKFEKEALRLIRLFADKFNIEKLTRTGLRYINVIPFVRGEGKDALSNYLQVAVKLPLAFPSEFRHLELAFVSQTEEGLITTRIEPLVAQNGTQAILLDFDFAMEKDLHIRRIKSYLDESHRHTKAMFEQIITDNYRKYIRGEAV